MSDIVSSEPKIGLALGSGGSRGLAHIGVIKVLAQAGIKISAIVGSSFGALVGGLYARDADVELVERAMVKAPDWRDILKLFFLTELSFSGSMMQQGHRLSSFVKREFGKSHFYNLAVPFGTVATKLITGEKAVFSTGEVAPAILASMAFPFLFPPVKIRGELYFDGGLVEAVPVPTVKAMGCDIVIAINLDGEELVHFEGNNSNPFHVFQQAVNISRYQLAGMNSRHATILIKPKTGLKGIIGWKGFYEGEKIIATGEKAMRAALPHLKEKIIHYRATHGG